MRKKIIVAVLSILTTASMAYADVSNEFLISVNGSTVGEYKDKNNLTGVTTDYKDKKKEGKATIGVQYTRFFSPLKDDGSSIELRRFHQHPSALAVQLGAVSSVSEDTSNPLSKDETSYSIPLIGLNGEFYLPTNTGILLGAMSASGEWKQKINNVETSKADLKMGVFEAGIRQYLFDALELGVTYSSTETTYAPKNTTTEFKEKKGILTGRAKLILANTVGLMAAYGGGNVESSSNIPASTTTKYDYGEATGELQFYGGKRFSIRLGGTATAQKQKEMAAGSKNETTTAKGYISPKIWFGENVGLELTAYSTKKEDNSKSTGPASDTTKSSTENGGEINLSIRF